MRALWPGLAARAGVPVTSAFAFESVMVEAFFITGPLVAGGSSRSPPRPWRCWRPPGSRSRARSPSPTAAASRGWSPEGNATRSRLGPLRSPAVLVLLAVGLPAGVAFGVLSLALPSFAVAEGSPGAAGVLWALQAIGSAVGGLWVGARIWRAPAERRYALFATAFAVGLAPLALAGRPRRARRPDRDRRPRPGPRHRGGVRAHRPRGAARHGTETFAWIITANVGGAALGAALGGGIVQDHGADAGFVVAALAAALAAAIAWAGLRVLARPSAAVPVSA